MRYVRWFFDGCPQVARGNGGYQVEAKSKVSFVLHKKTG